MHEFDIALKTLFSSPASLALRAVIGGPVRRWLNVELPVVRNPRVDLLGETSRRALVQIEFQSSNDPRMGRRMAAYYLAVADQLDRYPRQVVVYVGSAKLSMAERFRTHSMSFRYKLVDIRDLDGERLLESPALSDNVLAILTRVKSQRRAIRQILRRIAEQEGSERETALRQLLLISGLRRLEERIEEEARSVPVLNDYLDNRVLGREFKKGLEKGRTEGLTEGRAEGELLIVRTQLERRFGALPAWAEQRLTSASEKQIQEWGLRILDARSLDEVFAA